MSFNGPRHELELQADVARDRLLETIGALDQRRHDVLDWKLQLRHHLVQVVLLGAAILGGIAVAAGAGIYRAKLSRAHRPRECVRAPGRVWEHPDRVAVRRVRPIRATVRIALLALVTLATARIVSRRG
jgi:hypothetical protein